MLKGKRILFYVPEGNLETHAVYASQVGGLADYVEAQGAKIYVWQNVKVGRMKFFQCIGRYQKAAREEASLKAFQPTHIYCRTFQTCLAARELARETGAKIVYSMRGADAAEAILLSKNVRGMMLALFAIWGVRRALQVADHVSAVSGAMAHWIKEKWGRNASVLPCCVSTSAFSGKKQMHYKKQRELKGCDGKVVVYCGGLSIWQCIDEVIVLMKRMGEIDPTMRFRFLTVDIANLQRKCDEFGLSADRWTSKSCKPLEVPEELAKADCGILIRTDTIVNQVASPVKLGEYLSAGLGLIVSPCVGDAAKEFLGKDFAKVMTEEISAKDLVSFVRGLDFQKSDMARQWAYEKLTYHGNDAAIQQMFA